MAKKPTVPPKLAPIGFGRRQMPDEAGAAPPRMRALDNEPEQSDEPTEEQDPFSDPNFDVLIDEIGKRFEVANSLDEAGLQLTTQQVYERLQAFYPSSYYSTRMVFDALRKLEFKFDDPFKDMNFVWLFK